MRPDPMRPDPFRPDPYRPAPRRDLRRSTRSGFKSLAVLVALLLFAAPAWGYIVFLQDGSQLNTKSAPEVRDDGLAYLFLINGTMTTLDPNEIDFEKTRKENAGANLGSARLIEASGESRSLKVEDAKEDEQTLGGLISGGQTSLSLPENRRRQIAGQEAIPTTPAGFVDLVALRRMPYEDAEVSSELQRYLQGQGVEGASLYMGTEPDRLLLEVTANSEASVFKIVKDAANALVQMHRQFPDRVAALELVMLTDAQVRAGQFVLTPELAGELVTGKMDAPSFFYRHVQF